MMTVTEDEVWAADEVVADCTVTGQTVVETAIVLVLTIVLCAGQSVTVAAQDVTVISVVEKTVDVE